MILPKLRRKEMFMVGLIGFEMVYDLSRSSQFTLTENTLALHCLQTLSWIFGTIFSIAGQAADNHSMSINRVNLQEELF